MNTERFWNQARHIVSGALLSIVAIPILSFTGISDAEAVPAFARKYDMSCNACHTRQPRLNPYGQRFMENGYQLPGTQDGGRKEKHLLGGETNGVTLDDISNLIAFRLRGDVLKPSFDDNNATESLDDVDIVFPNIMNIFIAGTVAKNISFFGEMEYASQEENPALAFERVFMVFDNLGGHQVANLKIGVFDPASMYSFPTHRQQLNPIGPQAETDTFPPKINRVPLLPLAFASKMFGLTTGPGDTTALGTYTASGGPPAGLPPLNGIELYAATAAGGAKEGLSILPFEPFLYNAPSQTGISVHGRPFGKSFLYQVGLARNLTAEDVPQARWDTYIMLRYDIQSKFSNLQFSGFYYTADKAARPTLRPAPRNRGGVPLSDFNPATGQTAVFFAAPVDWKRFGLAARWQYKALDIYGTFIKDKIDEPDFGNMAANSSVWETDAQGVSIEADWLMDDKWLLGVRYDSMQTGGLSYLPGAFRLPDDPKLNQDASFLGVIAKYYPSPNIGLYARYHQNLESSAKLPGRVPGGGGEHPATNLNSVFTVGVDMAF